MTVVLGPLDCLTCRRPVLWDRVGGQWRLMERTGAGLRRHSCRRTPIRSAASAHAKRPTSVELCEAWMPLIEEPCARAKGHADSHRSRYDLDNQARARRGYAA